MKNCLYCYETLHDTAQDYHTKCSRKFFGTGKAPALDYTLKDMGKLAGRIVERSVTVPGAQAKLSLNLNKEKNKEFRFTLVGLWGEYILKPPADKYPELPQNEDTTLHLAEILKIPVVPHSLIKLKSGELAYISKRIDRDKKGKLHMEDMCQLTERLTEDKYKGSMEQVAKALRKHSSNPMLDIVTFFEVALFSFLTGNADMHLKNFSIIDRRDGMTAFTPAYDLLSSRLVLSAKQDPEEMALTINAKKRKISFDDFYAFGKHIGLTQKQIDNVLKKFQKNLSPVNSFIDKSFLSDKNKIAYKNLIKQRAKRLNLTDS